jgi:hypothetical protein
LQPVTAGRKISLRRNLTHQKHVGPKCGEDISNKNNGSHIGITTQAGFSHAPGYQNRE